MMLIRVVKRDKLLEIQNYSFVLFQLKLKNPFKMAILRIKMVKIQYKTSFNSVWNFYKTTLIISIILCTEKYLCVWEVFLFFIFKIFFKNFNLYFQLKLSFNHFNLFCHISAKPIQNGNTQHQNGNSTSKKLTDEKLPPIHPGTPKSPKNKNRKVIEKGSSIPKLPKLVEEDNNLNNEQLTKVHEHLEKMEDQDKIYVIEVK